MGFRKSRNVLKLDAKLWERMGSVGFYVNLSRDRLSQETMTNKRVKNCDLKSSDLRQFIRTMKWRNEDASRKKKQQQKKEKSNTFKKQ